MGSEQVASVLRQSGSHVRLIVARSVTEPFPPSHPHAPIVPTHQLDEHLHHLYAALVEAENQDYEHQLQHMDMITAEYNAQVHPVSMFSLLLLNFKLYLFYKNNTWLQISHKVIVLGGE